MNKNTDEKTKSNNNIEKEEKKFAKHEKELLRLEELSKFEREYNEKGYELIGGIDEAGRGPLAGPVVAACVILPKGCVIEGVNDSKKLSEKKREALYDEITEKAVAWGVGIMDNNVIDDINILEATRNAMTHAVEELEVKPDYIFIDAEKKVDTKGIPYLPIVKGDALSISIAAASIIAKVTRDRMMKEYDKMFPCYGFEKHKGYGTKAHTDAIKENGLCMIHRKSFCTKFI
ncbi:MAG: ribonuclease HII [Clostridia bacterium]|nr:ribonuclease HII [Clostridia bacterium]